MKLAAVLLVLLISIANAEFAMESVEVRITDIQSDGSARVHESIKFLLYGDSTNSLYDSGIPVNQLSFWSNITKLKDVKMHVNPSVVDIQDFRLRPQPRTKCNPIQGLCHGELILDYYAFPSYSENETKIEGTGLFFVDQYKPRTMRYTINPPALAFTTTPEGNIILDEKVYLVIDLPDESVTLDVNPQPQYETLEIPSHIDSISWEDIVLVKFSLIFELEHGIDREVSDFFANIAKATSQVLGSADGIPLALLILIIIGTYLYISMAKRRGEG